MQPRKTCTHASWCHVKFGTMNLCAVSHAVQQSNCASPIQSLLLSLLDDFILSPLSSSFPFGFAETIEATRSKHLPTLPCASYLQLCPYSGASSVQYRCCLCGQLSLSPHRALSLLLWHMLHDSCHVSPVPQLFPLDQLISMNMQTCCYFFQLKETQTPKPHLTPFLSLLLSISFLPFTANSFFFTALLRQYTKTGHI